MGKYVVIQFFICYNVLIEIDSIQVPKRVYLLADDIYDAMIERDCGEYKYPLGGSLYVKKNNPQVGFIKAKMCSPGIATQAEDLVAGGVEEFIHIAYMFSLYVITLFSFFLLYSCFLGSVLQRISVYTITIIILIAENISLFSTVSPASLAKILTALFTEWAIIHGIKLPPR